MLKVVVTFELRNRLVVEYEKPLPFKYTSRTDLAGRAVERLALASLFVSAQLSVRVCLSSYYQHDLRLVPFPVLPCGCCRCTFAHCQRELCSMVEVFTHAKGRPTKGSFTRLFPVLCCDDCCGEFCSQQTAMMILAPTKRSTPKSWRKSRRKGPNLHGWEGAYAAPRSTTQRRRWRTTNTPKQGPSNTEEDNICLRM